VRKILLALGLYATSLRVLPRSAGVRRAGLLCGLMVS
jgi:hypothetical protein